MVHEVHNIKNNSLMRFVLINNFKVIALQVILRKIHKVIFFPWLSVFLLHR